MPISVQWRMNPKAKGASDGSLAASQNTLKSQAGGALKEKNQDSMGNIFKKIKDHGGIDDKPSRMFWPDTHGYANEVTRSDGDI